MTNEYLSSSADFVQTTLIQDMIHYTRCFIKIKITSLILSSKQGAHK